MQKVEFRLALMNGINPDLVTHWQGRIITAMEQPNFGELTLLLASEGGSTDSSVAFYNWLRQLPVPVHIHAMGHVGSAANIVFQAGAKRSAATHSRFFFHQYDWGFNQRQTFRGLEEAVHRLQDDIGMAKRILAERTKLDEAFLATLDGQAEPRILKPAEAVELGVANVTLDLPTKRDDGLVIANWT